MQIDYLESHDRRLMVEFTCRRCKKTAIRPLEQCMKEVDYNHLWDLRPPKGWENGGFYYPIFCPDCSAAHKRFMNMEVDDG